MPASLSIRATVALASFTATALAGWITMNPGQPSVRVAVNESGTPQQRAAAETKPAGKSAGAATAKFERTLTQMLHPDAARAFSGARLEELCMTGQVPDLPHICSGVPYGRRWAEQAPEQMFAWFQQQGTFALPKEATLARYSFIPVLFETWTVKDSAAALRAALQCTEKWERMEAVACIIRTLRKSDPAKAAAVAAEHIGLLAGPNSSLNYLGDQNRETWDFLSSLPRSPDRNRLLAQHIERQFAAGRGPEGEQWWNSMPADWKREMIEAGFPGYYVRKNRNRGVQDVVVLDGTADLQRQRLEQPDNSAWVAEFLGTGGWKWGEQDPAAAVAWMQQNLKGEQRVKGIAQMILAGAGGNFDAALQVWQTLPEGILRARAAGNLAAGAPAARREEVQALLGTLSPQDRSIAESARQSALRQRSRLGVQPTP